MLLAIVTLLALAHALAAAAKNDAPIPTIDPATCPEIKVDPAHVLDYRIRDSSAWMKFQYEDNWNNHTSPAVEHISAGEYSHRVMADLNFTLSRWTNHVVALEALIQYTVAGGKSYEFPPAECYFASAHRWDPDDISPYLLEGQFYFAVHQYERAAQSYQQALKIDDGSADAHYNLGLVYLQLQNYDAALSHAQAAYLAGYPLPGLRKRLQDLGKWREPVKRTADNSNAAPAATSAQH